MAHTMKAIVRDAYGPADVLRLAEIDAQWLARARCRCGLLRRGWIRVSGT
jgi:hypothetical protein